LELVNATGEQLMKLDASIETINEQLSQQFRQLTKGIYFVRMFDGQSWQTIKVIN
jgi:hypothetical protein